MLEHFAPRMSSTLQSYPAWFDSKSSRCSSLPNITWGFWNGKCVGLFHWRLGLQSDRSQPSQLYPFACPHVQLMSSRFARCLYQFRHQHLGPRHYYTDSMPVCTRCLWIRSWRNLFHNQQRIINPHWPECLCMSAAKYSNLSNHLWTHANISTGRQYRYWMWWYRCSNIMRYCLASCLSSAIIRLTWQCSWNSRHSCLSDGSWNVRIRECCRLLYQQHTRHVYRSRLHFLFEESFAHVRQVSVCSSKRLSTLEWTTGVNLPSCTRSLWYDLGHFLLSYRNSFERGHYKSRNLPEWGITLLLH
jgi:hypothetical protein